MASEASDSTPVAGPYFDELKLGQVFADPAGITLTSGLAAVHNSIVGTRFHLSKDHHLSQRVTGFPRPLADPALAWDVAIGQSTHVTGRVRANLFYRGLAFHRFPQLDDTLYTRTEIIGLKQNSSSATGLAALRITSSDQERRLVLDFIRCAMLPLSAPQVTTVHHDDLDSLGTSWAPTVAIDDWNLNALQHTDSSFTVGQRWRMERGDVVSSAPELARITGNLAAVHHDRTFGRGERLVYGGHTIGIALGQVTRAIPTLITVLAWESCDHTGPVREGDTLRSVVEIESAKRSGSGGWLLGLRSRVFALGAEDFDRDVLNWRFTALAL